MTMTDSSISDEQCFVLHLYCICSDRMSSLPTQTCPTSHILCVHFNWPAFKRSVQDF